MEKLGNLRQDVEDCTKLFDDAQDQYAAEMYDFLFGFRKGLGGLDASVLDPLGSEKLNSHQGASAALRMNLTRPCP